mmetsp:Transcript_2505/g.5312  ORF Transcript_2505/g.5312 Transcript_2505/m.5312 type:complete len:359 (-) Transcript_2505:880-1956(-)
MFSAARRFFSAVSSFTSIRALAFTAPTGLGSSLRLTTLLLLSYSSAAARANCCRSSSSRSAASLSIAAVPACTCSSFISLPAGPAGAANSYSYRGAGSAASASRSSSLALLASLRIARACSLALRKEAREASSRATPRGVALAAAGRRGVAPGRFRPRTSRGVARGVAKGVADGVAPTPFRGGGREANPPGVALEKAATPGVALEIPGPPPYETTTVSPPRSGVSISLAARNALASARIASLLDSPTATPLRGVGSSARPVYSPRRTSVTRPFLAGGGGIPSRSILASASSSSSSTAGAGSSIAPRFLCPMGSDRRLTSATTIAMFVFSSARMRASSRFRAAAASASRLLRLSSLILP